MNKFFIFIFFAFLPQLSSANWFQDIINAINEQGKKSLGLSQLQLEGMDRIYDINQKNYKTNQSQLEQMTKIMKGLTGTHDYGNQYYDHNRFNWGSGADDWQSILAMTKNSQSDSQLNAYMNRLSNEYPIKPIHSKNEMQNQFYLMQAQNALATRASAHLTFKELHEEEKTMRYLHNQIDRTEDNKSAVDLNNRLLAENAMINIQQTKLIAILAEQAALNAQEKANLARESAEFFNLK